MPLKFKFQSKTFIAVSTGKVANLLLKLFVVPYCVVYELQPSAIWKTRIYWSSNHSSQST